MISYLDKPGGYDKMQLINVTTLSLSLFTISFILSLLKSIKRPGSPEPGLFLCHLLSHQIEKCMIANLYSASILLNTGVSTPYVEFPESFS